MAATSPGLVFALGVLLVVASAFEVHGAPIDDAWITYRYAYNLAHGLGWEYDLHRTTADGATAPLYTVLLAGLSFVTGSVPRAATTVFAASLGGTALATYVLFARRRMALAGVSAAVLIVTSPFMSLTRGMESAPFLCLAVLAVELFDSDRPAACGVVCALLTFVRDDGAVLAGLLVLGFALRQRHLPWRFLVGLGCATVPWSIFASTVVGAVVPGTLGAKVAQGSSGYWGYGHLYLRGVARVFGSGGIRGWSYLVVALAAVGVGSVVVDRARTRLVAPICLFALTIFLVYGLLLNPPGYTWYYATPLLGVLILAGSGAGEMIEQAWRRRRRRRVVALLGAAALAAAVLAGIADQPTNRPSAPYLAAASWIRRHVPAQDDVAATEIGLIGWYSHRDIVDYLGLLSTRSVSDLRRRDLTSWLARDQPDYWLVHDGAWNFERPALALDWFTAGYVPVWSGQHLVLWQRERPLPDAERISSLLRADVSVPGLAHAGVRPGAPTASDADAVDAVAALAAVVAQRDDLRRRFLATPVGAPGGLRLALGAAVAWAITTGVSTDPEADGLAPFRTALDRLARALGSAVVPISPAGGRVLTSLAPPPPLP